MIQKEFSRVPNLNIDKWAKKSLARREFYGGLLCLLMKMSNLQPKDLSCGRLALLKGQQFFFEIRRNRDGFV